LRCPATKGDWHMKIARVGVVGAGTMGSGIAEVCARGGLDTMVVDVDQPAIERAMAAIDASLARAVRKGLIDSNDVVAVKARLHYDTSLDAMADRDLVIEAVIEREDAKHEVFRELDKRCEPHTIFASNTSSIPIVNLATATSRPDKVAGLHFFNPAPVQPLVEVVHGLTTSQETVDALEEVCSQSLGKEVIRCRDRAGFVVNALLVPYLLSAVRMLESGFASAADIDRGMKHGCAHPMGHCRRGGRRVVPRVPRAVLCPAAAAQAHGLRRPARPQERPGLLRLQTLIRSSEGTPCTSNSNAVTTTSR
jgi:3-hydroxybutyryl-CoA dehydrogenase